MHENRETSVVPDTVTGRSGKAYGRTPDMHAAEESDFGVVPVNQPNKGGEPLAEVGEGRPEIKENIAQSNTQPTQSGGSVSHGLSGVRQRAKERKQEKFTALLHHLTVDLLRESYFALQRKAAPGVDGETWRQYGAGLEDRLADLHSRVHRGAYLRNELCSNNLRNFGLKKGLDHLGAVRERFKTITDRFAGFQAQCLNVHVDFPLLQRLALPITIGSVRYPGVKIHDARIIRLLEVLLHGGNTVGGWTAKQIHSAIATTFQLSAKTYGLNQLRYDLRKLKGHGLLERDGRRYAYQLTAKGIQVALLFLFFHKRLCGPLANSRFHHQPDSAHPPDSKLEAAYHKADKAIENIVALLAAA